MQRILYKDDIRVQKFGRYQYDRLEIEIVKQQFIEDEVFGGGEIINLEL